MYLFVFEYVHMSVDAHGSQKREWGSLELELHAAVSHQILMLGPKLGSAAIVAQLSTVEPSCQHPLVIF